MFNLVKPIKEGLAPYLKYQEISTDNVVFRLHTIFTPVALTACSVMLTAIQFVGSPIDCFGMPDKMEKPINTFCWTTTTFTIPKGFNKEVGKEVAHPGIMNGEEKKYYTYYQWVCFVLFFQAILCYMPKALWDLCEGKLMSTLASGLNRVCPPAEKEKRTECIIGYLFRHQKMHKSYAFKYWGCELLCFVSTLLQMWMMDKFLGGQFLSYGTRVLQNSALPHNERTDPMIFVFPRVTKCTFHSYGPSGGIQTLDVLCILPQNVVNEKVYIFLWFWYIILAVLLGLLVTYRLVILFLPAFRPRLLLARAQTLSFASVDAVSRFADCGDWWLLYKLGRNMDPLIYREFISEYASRRGVKLPRYPPPLEADNKPLLDYKKMSQFT